MMKRTPLKRVSDKRRSQNQKYRRLATRYLAEHPFCEICKERSTQVHHQAGRNGDRLLVTNDWLAVCPACHDKIHAHGAWAREHGYLHGLL